MKKCRRCSKPAVLHITEIREGDVQALHLCETCAHEYLGAEEESGDDEPIGGLAEKLSELGGDDDEELEKLICPNCGISFQEFRSKGRLGCPHDYVEFADELMPLLENIHGEMQHCGKFPKRAPDASQRHYQLIKLRNELRSAVEEEKYETAASLRDRIQTLEAEFGNEPDSAS